MLRLPCANDDEMITKRKAIDMHTCFIRIGFSVCLCYVLLFIIFHAKRKQRIVPVIEPLQNSSAEFVKTIGNLYLQEGNFKDMANKVGK